MRKSYSIGILPSIGIEVSNILFILGCKKKIPIKKKKTRKQSKAIFLYVSVD
jgi:hypothetical protein